jgi:hypothetical protein
VTTGAQCFDHWFGRRPSRSREEFCREIGLDPARPFILYVCSALFRGSPSEAEFVCRWARHLRQAPSSVVRDAGLLVRPHPQRMYEWDGVRLPDGVAFLGGHPIDERGRDDYFDSMYHASAVVGLNTSALIECAIVDRPVLTMLLPEFRESQRGTLHFPYLLDGPYAMLHAARDLDEHITQLDGALAGRLPNRNTAFVRHFIRPHGVDRAATPVFVDALESQAASPAPAPRRPAIGDAIWSPVIRSWYAAAERPSVRWMMLEAAHVVEERERAERIAGKRAHRRAHAEERQARVDAKEERYRVKRRHQRIVQLKTAVRRVLTAGAGRAGSQS